MKYSTLREFKQNKFSLESIPGDCKIHFIGLGGIGMSGLARILQDSGYKISGSDLNKNHLMEYFEKQGAEVYVGHAQDNLNNACAVVKSSAIKDDNPEYKKALENNIPVIHRAELLNALMTGFGQKSIGITGTHGKTTTTGMIATIFYEAGLDPGFAIGGEIPQLKTNSAYGKGGYFISELDESDGTVELYAPDVSIITNLELEHTDYYQGGFEQLLGTMERFIANTGVGSGVIINIDDPGNNALIDRIGQKNFITYSLENSSADYFAQIIQSVPDAKMKIFKKDDYQGEIGVGVPGVHNISNALGAVAASMECGLEFEQIKKGLAKFTGMKKRFQTVGFANGARLIDDYAHHPTEVAATINTARKIVDLEQKGRVIAVFQPHRYTRLENFWDEFLKSFDEADIVYICDVYSAEEKPIKGVNSREFSRKLQHKNACYIKGGLSSVADGLIKEIQPGDMVLTMGAGNITKLGGIIIDKAD